MHVTGDDDGTVVAAADPEYDMDAHLRGDAQVRWARCGAVGLREARSGVAGRRAAAPATAAASAALSLLVLGARDGQQQLIPALHPAGAREAARRGARRGARRSARREPQAQAGPAPAPRPFPAAPRAGGRASAQPPARVAGGPARRGAAAGPARRVTLRRRFTPGRLGSARVALLPGDSGPSGWRGQARGGASRAKSGGSRRPLSSSFTTTSSAPPRCACARARPRRRPRAAVRWLGLLRSDLIRFDVRRQALDEDEVGSPALEPFPRCAAARPSRGAARGASWSCLVQRAADAQSPPGALTRAEPAPGEDRVARAEGEGAARRSGPVHPRGPRDAP